MRERAPQVLGALLGASAADEIEAQQLLRLPEIAPPSNGISCGAANGDGYSASRSQGFIARSCGGVPLIPTRRLLGPAAWARRSTLPGVARR
jgi:hypothetical protein